MSWSRPTGTVGKRLEEGADELLLNFKVPGKSGKDGVPVAEKPK